MSRAVFVKPLILFVVSVGFFVPTRIAYLLVLEAWYEVVVTAAIATTIIIVVLVGFKFDVIYC